jgi:hypothetical protein
MARKSRQTAAGEFIDKIGANNKVQLERFLTIPNIAAKEIHEFLVDLGFQGSLNSVYNWLEQQQAAGVKAAALNVLLKDFQGVDHGKILEKLIVTLSVQLDNAIEAIENQRVDAEHYVKIFPSICRELSSIISTYNELRYVKDRKSLEMAGATRLARGLMILFKGEAFAEALEEGISSVVLEMEENT